MDILVARKLTFATPSQSKMTYKTALVGAFLGPKRLFSREIEVHGDNGRDAVDFISNNELSVKGTIEI